MTACPACHSEDVRAGWPENIPEKVASPAFVRSCWSCALVLPLTCKKCGHEWSVRYLPPQIEGERLDQEAATA